MDRKRHDRVTLLFARAVELDSAPRAAFLDEECGEDRELRAEVESLLAHESRGAEMFDSRGGQVRPTVTKNDGDGDETPLERVGPYRILRPIGTGGMGEVYLAEQQQPVRRRVALKLIKAGMDSKQVIAHFESERQALALMTHPCIARVLDAGTTERGRPYFAMEYVPGDPITEYCDRSRLSTHERLRLFVQVCEGVQHAHQKGIIHRDLKPSNVLVTVDGERAMPKIIDFGVAKATEPRLTERRCSPSSGC